MRDACRSSVLLIIVEDVCYVSFALASADGTLLPAKRIGGTRVTIPAAGRWRATGDPL